MDKVTPIGLLITGITVLAGCIAPLVLYIKNLHKNHEEKVSSLHKSYEDKLSELYKDNLKMTKEMVDAINRNSDTTERNNITVNDLHKYILSQKDK